jgi:hypothetical protein
MTVQGNHPGGRPQGHIAPGDPRKFFPSPVRTLRFRPMRNQTAGAAVTSTDAILTRTTWLALGLAGLLTGLWLWSSWCSFPSNPWNDIRVAPAVALHHGISIYTTANEGPVSTWIYGPLPLLLLWPAGLASNATGAIQVAGALHLGLKALPLVLVCLLWPSSRPAPRNWAVRLGAALLCVLLVRNASAGYLVYTADTPGLAFALLGLLALVRQHRAAAALCAAAAVACKQTFVGVAVAQVVWLFFADSPRAAGVQLGRCLVGGLAAAALAVLCFGGPGLWHTMVDIPARFPFAPAAERLRLHWVYLTLHVVLPLVGMLAWRRFFFARQSPVLLPALAFFCLLPLSFTGFHKSGGNVNSLHSFWVWFPPVLVALATAWPESRANRLAGLVLAISAAALASLWLQITPLRVRPNLQAYEEARHLATHQRGRVWFPMHPLVTLYSDGRFYHDFDGLNERLIAGNRLTDEHFLAHMPRRRQVVATLLPIGWGPADPAEARLPANTPVTQFGSWQLQLIPEGRGGRAAP